MQPLAPELTAKLARIKLLSLDVDGVLTDGRLVYNSDGSESKAFNTQDGYALKTLAATGVKLSLIHI